MHSANGSSTVSLLYTLLPRPHAKTFHKSPPRHPSLPLSLAPSAQRSTPHPIAPAKPSFRSQSPPEQGAWQSTMVIPPSSSGLPLKTTCFSLFHRARDGSSSLPPPPLHSHSPPARKVSRHILVYMRTAVRGAGREGRWCGAVLGTVVYTLQR